MRKSDFLFAVFIILSLVFIYGLQYHVSKQGNHDSVSVEQGNHDNNVKIKEELCSVAVGKMLSAWNWDGDIANVKHHEIADRAGEVVARTIVIYYVEPKPPEEEVGSEQGNAE